MKRLLIVFSVILLLLGQPKITKAEKVCNCGKVVASDCCWEFKGNTLFITGSGAMKDYNLSEGDRGKSGNQPWVNLKDSIETINISGVTSVGASTCSFCTNLKDIQLGDSIESIGYTAFYATDFKKLNIPDSVKFLDWAAFLSGSAETIIVPDTATNLSQRVFGDRNVEIICKGSEASCQNIKNQLSNYRYFNHDTNQWQNKNLGLNVRVANNPEECSGSKHYYNGLECVRRPTDGTDITCINGYKKSKNNCINCSVANKVEWNGECYDEYPFAKKHYTPAEAAEWLHDGNDNFVIITFKK